MEFGRVPEDELNDVDFSLPNDPALNSTILKGAPFASPKVHIGCPRWGSKDWVGKIYPPKTKEKDFLQEYVHHFNSVELNATHYKIYDEAAIKKWAEKADKLDFLFCPKLSKEITHVGNLMSKDLITTEFLKGIFGFGKHLGPILIQVSESFSPARKQELYDYLETLPADLCFFVEVRHPDFFAKKENAQEYFTSLKERNIGAVISDTAGRRDCAHMYLTMPKTFIRYVGNSLHPSDYTRIDAWVDRMKYWLDNGLKDLYFFMHMQNEATSPELTVYLVDEMNKKCKLDLKKPMFFPEQNSLFD